MINSHTEIYCIIGNPVKHSLSPLMYNEAFKQLGLNKIFLAFEVKNLKSAIYGLKSIENIRGIVVTVPFKEKVIFYLDSLDETAEKIGAVNAVKCENGCLKGINTDWIGATKALEEKTVLKSKKVAVIGAGGAARAVCFALKRKGALVTVFNRTREKAQKLSDEFGLENAFGLENQDKIKEADIVINTTSVGMTPQENVLVLDPANILSHHIVFDIVYTPSETKLLKLARGKGAKTVKGYKMILYGGLEIFKYFLCLDGPAKVMEKVLVNNLS